ncbi:MAG: alginate lyase family protein [Herminiimonas sp.]|nr:alginate lyase family protein [Herminiimonas sp.]
MRGAEIVWRCRRALQARFEQAGYGLLRCPASLAVQPPHGSAWADDLPVQFASAAYLRRATRTAAGRFDIFAMRDVALGFPPPWNRDPKTGTTAPLDFGKRLDYRDPARVGDIKYLWEPNRHYELVGLAQAYHLTKEQTWLSACRDLLASWFDDCPYPRGQAWSSALENAVRLVNWALAWHLLGGATSALFKGGEGVRLRQRWLLSVQQHCHFIGGHLSLHSSANNHLMGEYMGLFIGALTWPYWQESASWCTTGRCGLEQQALLQNGADGVNREQAIWYHHEVADMLLLCALFGRANAQPLSDASLKQLERMLEFIDATMDVAGNVPMIGDADDAALRLSCDAHDNPYRALLATGAVLFGRADFAVRAGSFDDKSRWLLGDAAALRFAALLQPAVQAAAQPDASPRSAPRRTFPDGGYYILGCDFDTASEIRLVADAGPLGYLGIAAHGHADALALTLSVAGLPMLIDPGTYAYHSQPEWRNYFRGTAAHNTVRVDGCDQSVIGGNFMWLQKAEAFCEAWHSTTQQDCLVAHHDGYLRLQDPVLHRRRIVFQKAQRLILVEDTLECRGTHAVELSWHFSDQCTVRSCSDGAIATRGKVRLHIGMPHTDARPDLVLGQTSPPLGWISHRFDEKCASPTVVWREKIVGTRTFTTQLAIRIA